jgi:bacterioferritin
MWPDRSLSFEADRLGPITGSAAVATVDSPMRYTHYSLLVFGFGRIPIVYWLRSQAAESLAHAQQVGGCITTLGAHPSLAIDSVR